MDFILDQLVDVYEKERDRWLRGALARRAETVVPRPSGEDIAVEQASTALGHDLQHHQTAFTIRAVDRDTAGSAVGALEGSPPSWQTRWARAGRSPCPREPMRCGRGWRHPLRLSAASWMHAFVASELGAGITSGRTAERLLGTALTFPQCNRNASATANVLGVHRNTVRNRVTRAEELLGRRLDPGNVSLQLALQLFVNLSDTPTPR